jgi:hypothetical protein
MSGPVGLAIGIAIVVFIYALLMVYDWYYHREWMRRRK